LLLFGFVDVLQFVVVVVTGVRFFVVRLLRYGVFVLVVGVVF
jgi:hypothetical protein